MSGIPQQVHKAAVAVDSAIGAGGMASIMWWPYIEGAMQVVVGVGGAFLIILRILIAWREWRNPKKD